MRRDPIRDRAEHPAARALRQRIDALEDVSRDRPLTAEESAELARLVGREKENSHWRASYERHVEKHRQRARDKYARSKAARPRTFEQQLAAVKAGAPIMEKPSLRAPEPDRSLVGCAAGMCAS